MNPASPSSAATVRSPFASTDDSARVPLAVRPASSLRQFGTLLLLVGGAQAWIGLGRQDFGETRQVLAGLLALIAAVVVWAVPALRNRAALLCERLGQPSLRTRVVTALSIALLSTVYLYATARGQGRDFAPVLHDEYVYALQSKMVAAGHLWMPKHAAADFFENFHLITDRAYASKYGPGTALWYAPAALLRLPPWLTPLLLSGAAVGLLYLLATELFDGTSGLLAALMLVSLGAFRRTSVMIMSQAPMLALLLVAMLAFVYWRRTRRRWWMLLLGVCVGWAAVTRPVDAVCLAVPLALAVLIELWRADARTRLRTLALGAIGVAPFVLLQAVYNKGVTGNFAKLPWSYYALRYDPYDTMGRRPLDDSLLADPMLPQKQALIDDFTAPAFRAKVGQSARARVVDRTSKLLAGPPPEEQEEGKRIYGALPSPLLIALLPVGLLGVLDRRRWMLWAPLPLFLLVYANYAYFFTHYSVSVIPAVILMVPGTITALRRTWPRRGAPVSFAIGLTVAAMSVAALPQLNPVRHDQWFDAPLLRDVDRALEKLDGPSLVLFTYDPERMIHEEPVYNIATAWPDDARVIRAHDLGGRNSALFAYYAARSPDRAVYRYDEKTMKLTPMGTVAELHRHPPATQPATRPATGPAKLGQ
jgi:hypothetical protein